VSSQSSLCQQWIVTLKKRDEGQTPKIKNYRDRQKNEAALNNENDMIIKYIVYNYIQLHLCKLILF